MFPPEAIGLHTKDSSNPIAFLMLGTVTGVQFGGDRLLLFYEDGRKIVIEPQEDGSLAVDEYEATQTC